MTSSSYSLTIGSTCMAVAFALDAAPLSPLLKGPVNVPVIHESRTRR